METAKKTIEVVFSIAEILRKLTLGPLHMVNLSGHTLKNLSCLTLLTILLLVSISGVAGGINLSLFGASAYSIVTVGFVSVVAFCTNLLLPPPQGDGEEVQRDTNKWISYCVVAFMFTVAAFLVLQLPFILGENGDVNYFSDWLAVEVFPSMSSDRAELLTSGLSGLLGTSILFALLFIGKRVRIGAKHVGAYYIATLLTCALTLHLTHFVLV